MRRWRSLDRAEELDPKNEDVQVQPSGAAGGSRARPPNARAMIETLTPLAQMDERVSELKARHRISPKAQPGADREEALEKRIATDEADLDARLRLAHVYVARQDYRRALEQLLAIVERDRKLGDDIGRETMLKVFELLGTDQASWCAEFRAHARADDVILPALGALVRRASAQRAGGCRPIDDAGQDRDHHDRDDHERQVVADERQIAEVVAGIDERADPQHRAGERLRHERRIRHAVPCPRRTERKCARSERSGR